MSKLSYLTECEMAALQFMIETTVNQRLISENMETIEQYVSRNSNNVDFGKFEVAFNNMKPDEFRVPASMLLDIKNKQQGGAE
jgi:hypothetical protein